MSSLGISWLVCRPPFVAKALVLIQFSSHLLWTWSSLRQNQCRRFTYTPEPLNHLQGSSIHFKSSEDDGGSDVFDLVACLAMYGVRRSYVHLYQALPSLLLPPPIFGQPEMAAHRLVGQHDLRHLVVFRVNRVLHFSVLASPILLDTVLSALQCWACTDGPVQRYHRSTRCPASNIEPYLGRRPLVTTRRSHFEASDIQEKEARSCYHIFGRSTVSGLIPEASLSRQHVFKADTACSACLLELARIIELEVDTDDSADPSCKRVPNYIQDHDTRLMTMIQTAW